MLCLPSYSYSEYIYGTTSNAASAGVNWVMANIIPQYTGLTVNGLVYEYTTVKNPEDSMVVTVQNENPVDGGYIFRDSQDWTGLSGSTYRRTFVLPYVPVEYWGNGSIEIDGEGQIIDPSVIYSYRYDDRCLDPQSDPTCPGYERQIPEVDVPEYTQPDFTQDELDRQNTFRDEEEEREDFLRMVDLKNKKRRAGELERMLGLGNQSDFSGPSEILHRQMVSMNYLDPSYSRVLPVTVYDETIVLQDSVLPDNSGVRKRNNLTQQFLHQQMVESQYEK